MIGMTPESTKDVKVTFPKDYHEQSLAGKEAVFKVTLHEIKTRVVPELTDDFVKELGIENVSTIKEYQTYLKTDMDRQKQIQSKNHILNSVIEAATEKAFFEIPEEMIKEEASRLDDQNRRQIKQYNLDFKIYLQYLGKTEEDYLRDLEMQAEKTLRQQL